MFINKNYNFKKIKIHPVVIALIGIILFFIITNIIWLYVDVHFTFSNDPDLHMARCLKYYMFLKPLKSVINQPSYLIDFWRYPPFFYISTIPLLLIFGIFNDHFVYVNFFYIILLILSVFGIGKILFNEWVGFFSALLTMLYPIAYGLSRLYFIDFALLAMVSLTQYLILKSEGGTKKYWNVALGIVVGCTLLTKTHGIIFFLPTWIIVFLMHYRKKKKLTPLLVTIIISLIIAAPWYIFLSGDLIHFIKHKDMNAWMKTLPENKNLFNKLCFYARLFNWAYTEPEGFVYTIHGGISPILSLAFLIGFILFLIFERRWKVFLILISWIIPSYFLLSLWPNKDLRFIMPSLPVFAFFTIAGFNKLPLKFIRNIIYSLIIGVGLIQFTNSLLNLPVSPKVSKFLFKSDCFCQTPKYEDFNFKIKEILSYISKCKGEKKLKIGVSAHPYIFFDVILSIAELNLPCTLEYFHEIFPCPLYNDKVRDVDILIIFQLPQPDFQKQEYYKKLNSFITDKSGFKKIQEFNLPNSSKAILYENVRKCGCSLLRTGTTYGGRSS